MWFDGSVRMRLLLVVLLLAGCDQQLVGAPDATPAVPDDDDATGDDDDATGDDDDATGDDDDATAPIDADGDGSSVEADCDDNDPTAYPGAEEICDGVDNDCDTEVDEMEPVDPGPATTLAVIGDFGNGSFNEGVVAAMVDAWSPAYIVTVGDNNYPDGEFFTIDFNIGCFYSEYIGNYQGICGQGSSTGNRFWPALGNHDWKTPGAQPHIDYFDLPGNERYYTFSEGPIDWFIVDSDPAEPDGTDVNSVQAAWLESALAASTAPYRIVALHHPPYSSGRGGSATWMQWPYEDWGADMVIAGHEHNYERTINQGRAYPVNGAGGASLRDFEEWNSFTLMQYDDVHGAQRIVVDNVKMHMQFIDTFGDIIDSYTLRVGAMDAYDAGNATVLLSEGATWSWWTTGDQAPNGWANPAFDDSTWNSGPAPLGYGNGDEATVLPWGSDPTQKWTTSYYRTSFNVDSVCALQHLRLEMARDDGAVVYLNGQEVYRVNLPEGAITNGTFAASTVQGQGETAFLDTWLDPSSLVVGANTIAVEIHQADFNSSDIRLDLKLTAY